MDISNMKNAEAETVAAMACQLAAYHGDTGTLDAAALHHLIRHNWCEVLVARASGKVIGYMALTRVIRLHEGRRGLQIEHLFVAPDWRRQRVGQRLIDAARGRALDQGCSHLHIGASDDNTRAAELYLRCGFVEKVPRGRQFSMPV